MGENVIMIFLLWAILPLKVIFILNMVPAFEIYSYTQEVEALK